MLSRHAVGALHDELVLDPKPGLVTPCDRGSHDDMDATTFLRSLFALRRYFDNIAEAGRRHAGFAELQGLGIAAEARMLRATRGVNTHRGAIFSLGLLCAAAASLPPPPLGEGRGGGQRTEPDASRWPLPPPSPRGGGSDIREALVRHWGDALRDRSTAEPGANTEAALGMPTLFDHAWPAFQAARRDRLTIDRCRLQAFFAAMAVLHDTNLVRRGGQDGLRFARSAAHRFLDDGGAGHPDAIARARRMGADFVARRLSPGGSADVLAGVCFLGRLVG